MSLEKELKSMATITKISVTEYAHGSKDAREATVEWLRTYRGMTITDRLIKRYQDEV